MIGSDPWCYAGEKRSLLTPARASSAPFAEYGREFQARAAEEVALLPEGSATAAMLGPYAVMREQAKE